MARRRRNRDKYNQVKPKVSPITYIMVGLFFFGIFFTMFMLIDTQKQVFQKDYNRAGSDLKANHNFKAISLKKLEKLIAKGDDVVVYIGAPSCEGCPEAVDIIQAKFDEGKEGTTNNVSSYVKVIYYIELEQQGEEGFGLEGLREFYTKLEITSAGRSPDLIGFRNEQVVFHYEPFQDNSITASQRLFRGITNFFVSLTTEFEKPIEA